MKTNWRIITVVITLTLIVVPAFAAVAGNAQPVSGICVFLDEPDSPDLVIWSTGPVDDLLWHMRNEKQLIQCDFDDPRLDGEFLLTVSWDTFILRDNQNWISIHDHGSVVVTDPEGNITWNGRYNNFLDEASTLNGTMRMVGLGDYQTQKFTGSVYFSMIGDPDWFVHIDGVIE